MKTLSFILAVSISLFSISILNAQIETFPTTIVKGQKVDIILEEASTKVIVNYHPKSKVSWQDTLSSPTPLKQFVWIPKAEGIITISAETSSNKTISKNISVRYLTYPKSGILTIGLAGLILFGGVGYSLWTLLGKK